jgi:hypothetical protein
MPTATTSTEMIVTIIRVPQCEKDQSVALHRSTGSYGIAPGPRKKLGGNANDPAKKRGRVTAILQGLRGAEIQFSRPG